MPRFVSREPYVTLLTCITLTGPHAKRCGCHSCPFSHGAAQFLVIQGGGRKLAFTMCLLLCVCVHCTDEELQSAKSVRLSAIKSKDYLL